MLDKALKLIAKRLKNHLNNRFDLEENVVELASPIAPDGVMPVEANDKLLVFLANVTKDTLPRTGGGYAAVAEGQFSKSQPLHLNLHIFVAANFRTQRYEDALAFLSAAILCIQEASIIDRSIEPDMPAEIDRLILEIENTDMNAASNLWGIMGGKYLPSVFYKVRMLCMDPSNVTSRILPASAPENRMAR